MGGAGASVGCNSVRGSYMLSLALSQSTNVDGFGLALLQSSTDKLHILDIGRGRHLLLINSLAPGIPPFQLPW